MEKGERSSRVEEEDPLTDIEFVTMAIVVLYVCFCDSKLIFRRLYEIVRFYR